RRPHAWRPDSSAFRAPALGAVGLRRALRLRSHRRERSPHDTLTWPRLQRLAAAPRCAAGDRARNFGCLTCLPLPEAIIHTKTNDAGLEADVCVDAAGGGPARRIAQVRIKIFDLRGPGTENPIFKAHARRPASAVDGRRSRARRHLNTLTRRD